MEPGKRQSFKARKSMRGKKGKPVFEPVALAVKRFKATVALAIILAAAYFFLSGGNLFIEKSVLFGLSFSLSKPLNIISYAFTHISPWHLAFNLVCLVFFAGIVERVLKWKHVLGIFLFSAALTVTVFVFLNPVARLAGASAGIWGLMASAFVLDLKKAVLSIIAVSLILVLVSQGIAFVVGQREQALVEKNEAIQNELVQALEAGNLEKASLLRAEKALAQKEMQDFVESAEVAAGANVDLFLHSYAGMLGIAYLLLFRRKQMIEAVRKQGIGAILKGKH